MDGRPVPRPMTPTATARPLGHRFDVGDRVRVVDLRKPGHVRTPDYIIGHVGEVIQRCGLFLNPEDLSVGITHGPVVALYRVRFPMADLWGGPARHPRDTLCIELYDHWLEPAGEAPR
jgi:nitrile hydratase subunit beta